MKYEDLLKENAEKGLSWGKCSYSQRCTLVLAYIRSKKEEHVDIVMSVKDIEEFFNSSEPSNFWVYQSVMDTFKDIVSEDQDDATDIFFNPPQNIEMGSVNE